jgi:hypothetical protein
MPLLEKIRLIDMLDKDGRKAILTFIDVAISRKHLKENISNLVK